MLEAGTARHPPVQMDRCEFHNDREVTRQMMMDGETGQEMPSGQMLAPPSTPKYFGPQDAFPAIRFPPSPPFAPTDNTLSAEKTLLHLSNLGSATPQMHVNVPGVSPIPMGHGLGSPLATAINTSSSPKDSPSSGGGFHRNTFAFSGIKQELSAAEGASNFGESSPYTGSVASSTLGSRPAMPSLTIDIPRGEADAGQFEWEGMGSVCVLDRPSSRSRSHSPLNYGEYPTGRVSNERRDSMDALRPYTPVYSGANPSVDEDMSDSFLITNAAWMAKNDEDADEDADTDMCCTPVGSSVTSSHAKSPERDPPRAPTRRMGGWGRQTTWKLEKRNSLFDAKDYTEMLLGRSPSELHYDGHYLLCDLLGKGSFGEVWSVMHYRTKLYYALKKSNQTFRGTRDRATFVREIKAMSTIAASVEHHPNIVKYERAWQDKGYFYIVMELCKEGTLRSLIDYNTQKNVAMCVDQIQILSQGLMTGLHHIHSANYLHLDLKPDNLFLSSNDGIKIGDFGLVVENGCWEDEEGDKRYMAPELLQGSADFKSDIFSAGLIVYQMLTGQQDLPGNGEEWHALRQPPPQKISLKVQSCSPEEWQLAEQMALVVTCMIDADPSNRPSTATLIGGSTSPSER